MQRLSKRPVNTPTDAPLVCGSVNSSLNSSDVDGTVIGVIKTLDNNLEEVAYSNSWAVSQRQTNMFLVHCPFLKRKGGNSSP